MAAIKFLNSITLEGSQIQNFLVQPVGTAPTVYGAGQLYYDTATNKLRLRDNTGWVNIQTGNDGNTTYELEVPTGTTNINLKATNPASNDAIILVGGTNISLVRDNDSQITINTTTTDAVTSVAKSAVNELLGIEVNPTVGNVIVGLDIAGQTPLGVGPDNDDELVLYDSSTTTNKSITVANLMLSAPQGDIKTIDPGPGIVVTDSGTDSPTVSVDYAGTDNVILAGADGTAITVVAGDKVLLNDTSSNDAKYVNISQLTEAIGGGTVESVAVTDGYLIDSTITSATVNPNITLDVDASELNDMTDAILTGDAFFVLDKSEAGKAQGKQKEASEIGLSIFNNDSGFITSAAIKTYALDKAAASSDLILTLDGTTQDTIAFNGTTNQVEIDIASEDSYTFKLPTTLIAPGTLSIIGNTITLDNNNKVIQVVDDNGSALSFNATGKAGILVIDSTNGAEKISTTGNLVVSGTGQSSFGGQVTVPTTPSASTDAASKAFVISESSSVGTFQGAYNASTNSPALSGASNVAMNQGDFYVVNTAGNAFFSTQLEPGDFIFANGDITAGSSPAVSAYTIIIADQNIAGAGSTDGNTQKGVSGFDSANFSVSSNGWVQITNVVLGTETSGNYTGSVAESGVNNRLGVDVTGAVGEGQAAIVGLDISGRTEDTTPALGDSLLIYDTSADTNKRVTVENLAKQLPSVTSFKDDYPATFTSTWDVIHSLGTLDVLVQVFILSTGATLYPDIVRKDVDTVTINCTDAQNIDSLRVLVTALA